MQPGAQVPKFAQATTPIPAAQGMFARLEDAVLGTKLSKRKIASLEHAEGRVPAASPWNQVKLCESWVISFWAELVNWLSVLPILDCAVEMGVGS